MLVQHKLITLLVSLLAQLPIHRQRPAVAPPDPAISFQVATDSIPQAQIAGVILPASGTAKGTVFLLHGYGRRKEDLYGWNWIRRDLRWNLVAFDFREHGQSTNSYHVCTLGYHEIWDVKAVIDEADKRGLAKPYVIYGMSMGASVGLRWATQDPRISGVLAVSPYRNALQAVQIFSRERMHLRQTLVAPQSGLGKMLNTVDLPTDVKNRRDLRIWIVCGEHDYFTATDQRAILKASPSPASLKKLFVIPGGTHNNLWRWRGDGSVPSHDQIVKDFLATTKRD
jgi:pimeloyl-ACP methyl ester carboxylesterase